MVLQRIFPWNSEPLALIKSRLLGAVSGSFNRMAATPLRQTHIRPADRSDGNNLDEEE